LLDAIDGANQRRVMGMTIMRALKQFFRRRTFVSGLALAATLYLLFSGWIVLLCVPFAILAVWTSSIFDQPILKSFGRYPLVGKVIGLPLVAALATPAISIIYRAWANGTVYDKGHILTFSADPVAFALSLSGALLFLLYLIALFGLLAWAYREERLSDQRFRNRPPLDQAIRRSIDER
jgi:hypothetical protein